MLTRYAIIDSTNVINVVEYEEAPGNPPPGFESPIIAVQSDVAGPGWTYVDNEFVAPPAPPTPVYVPQQAPMWAVRSVLKTGGLFDQAQSIIDASTNENLKLVWEYGNYADRNSPSIAALASEIGLTEAQIDQMFIDANNIVV